MLRPKWLAICAGGVLAVLTVLAQYDGMRFRSQLPSGLEYMPPSAELRVLLPNLGLSWDALLSHGAPEFGVREKAAWLELGPLARWFRSGIAKFDDAATAACVFWDDVEALTGYGIDADRSLGMSFWGPSFGYDNAVVVVPITDVERFTNLIGSFETKPTRVLLQPDDAGGRTPARYNVRRVDDMQYGRLCAPGRRATIRGVDLELPANVEAPANGAQLTFIANPFHEGELRLACTVVYDDGTSGDCLCRTGPGKDMTRACPVPFGFGINHEIRNRYRVEFKDVAGHRTRFLRGFPIAFPDDKTAVLSAEPALIASALGNPKGNLAANIDSRPMRQAMALLKNRGRTRTHILFGFLRLPPFLRLGEVSFSVHADHRALEASATINVHDWGLKFIRGLVSPPQTKTSTVPVPPDAPGSLAIAHRDAMYFVDFILRYVGGAREGATRALGEFMRVVETLILDQSSPAVGLFVVGARQGLPVFASAARLPGSSAAGSLVLRLQRKLRIERDISVLSGAALKYCRAEKRAPTIDGLLGRGQEFLTGEDLSTWHHYRRIGDSKLCASNTPDKASFALRQELTKELFDTDHYNTTIAGRQYQFVTPKVTTNDLVYRFDKGDLSDAEKDRLRHDVNRIAAYYQPSARLLWFGIDAEAIHHSIELSHRPTHTASSVDRDKNLVQLRLLPAWWISQGLGHPDSDVQRASQKFLDFARYQAIQLTVQNSETGNDVTVHASFSR